MSTDLVARITSGLFFSAVDISVDEILRFVAPVPGATGAKAHYLPFPPPKYLLRFVTAGIYSGLTFASKNDAENCAAALNRDALAHIAAKQAFELASKDAKAGATAALLAAQKVFNVSLAKLKKVVWSKEDTLAELRARAADDNELALIARSELARERPGVRPPGRSGPR